MQRQCERVVQQVVDALPQLERLKHSLGSESLAALQFMLEDDDANHHHNNGSGHGNNNGELMRYFVGASATELDSDDESLAPSDGVSVGSLLSSILEHGVDDRADSPAAAALPAFHRQATPSCALRSSGPERSQAGMTAAAPSSTAPAPHGVLPAAAPATARISSLLLLPGVVSEAFAVD